MKKKAEERAEKAKQRAKAVEERAKKKEEMALTRQARKKTAPKRAAARVPECSSSGSTSNPTLPQTRSKNLAQATDPEINSNVCCVCFRTYEEDIDEDTGMEWVECDANDGYTKTVWLTWYTMIRVKNCYVRSVFLNFCYVFFFKWLLHHNFFQSLIVANHFAKTKSCLIK